jgi:hypothetical protein
VTAPIDPAVRRAFGLEEREPVGFVLQLDGTWIHISADGAVDPVLPPGHPHAGAASDPVNRRTP